jgi:histidinol dehydrogenase
VRIVSASDSDWPRVRAGLANRQSTFPEGVERSAAAIVSDVRERGDVALRDYTERFERRSLDRVELDRATWGECGARVDPLVRSVLERAACRIRAFHEQERAHGPSSFETSAGGIRLASVVTPLRRVGIYVPGGTARYPSTVLMTAIPAKVAGVQEVVMVTPAPSDEALAAASLAGVDRVFPVGGAQAIAALAYGTQSIPRVDKIVGPGNAYVTAAKRLVFGDVGIDALAGPTEVAIAADASAEPAWVAADLLAQAEHDAMSVPILVAVGRHVADRILAEIDRQLLTLPRRAIAMRALADHGICVVVASRVEAIALLSEIAPEHAGLALVDAQREGPSVAAGAVFVGHHASEAVGDYLAGPSHVLPTGGSARFASPLGVGDFLKRTSIIEYSAEALAEQSADIVRLAEVEGLAGHGRAVAIRGARSPQSD